MMKRKRNKQHSDKRYCAKCKDLKPGNKVLLKQRKTMVKPPYNPNPYTVVAVKGNKITIYNGEHKLVQDKNKLKYVLDRPSYLTDVSQKLSTTICR